MQFPSPRKEEKNSKALRPSQETETSKMKRGNVNLIIRIVFTVIGIVSGVTIFVHFIIARNVNAAIWGLLSSFFAMIVLGLLIAKKKDVVVARYPQKTMRHLKHFGVFGSFAALVAAVTYFTLAIVLKQGYKMEGNGYIPAGIFSLLTLKWTSILFSVSRHYETLYSDGEEMHIAENEGSA